MLVKNCPCQGLRCVVAMLASELSLYLNSPLAFPQCHDLKSNSFFKLFPPCLPQCHDLKSTSLFKLPFPCHPLCHNLKSNSLFKLSPLAFHCASAPQEYFAAPNDDDAWKRTLSGLWVRPECRSYCCHSHFRSCLTSCLTFFRFSPLSLRHGVVVVCFEVPG